MVASFTTRANLTPLLAEWDKLAGLDTCETHAAAIIVCSATVKLSPDEEANIVVEDQEGQEKGVEESTVNQVSGNKENKVNQGKRSEGRVLVYEIISYIHSEEILFTVISQKNPPKIKFPLGIGEYIEDSELKPFLPPVDFTDVESPSLINVVDFSDTNEHPPEIESLPSCPEENLAVSNVAKPQFIVGP